MINKMKWPTGILAILSSYYEVLPDLFLTQGD
jgi:hypothetical protein